MLVVSQEKKVLSPQWLQFEPLDFSVGALVFTHSNAASLCTNAAYCHLSHFFLSWFLPSLSIYSSPSAHFPR